MNRGDSEAPARGRTPRGVTPRRESRRNFQKVGTPSVTGRPFVAAGGIGVLAYSLHLKQPRVCRSHEDTSYAL